MATETLPPFSPAEPPTAIIRTANPLLRKMNRLSRTNKIVKPSQYRELRANGRTLSCPYFLINAKENQKPDSRLGMVVRKKIGSAVIRNRTKRVFREIFRLNRDRFHKPIDLVIVVRETGSETPFKKLESELNRLVGEFFQHADFKNINKN